MALWNKKRLERSEAEEVESRIEVVTSKEATHEQVKQVAEANNALQKVLDANHFTIKIYLASREENTRKKKLRGRG